MSTSPTDSNRPAPADEPAERALLGAAMLRPEAADILTALGPDLLNSTNHKHIAVAIISLHADHQPVDFGQVASRMPPKLLEQVGGINELIAIQTTVPSSGNAAGYAERIRQAAQRRMLVGLAGDLRDRAYDGRDVEGVLAELGQVEGEGVGSKLDQLRLRLIRGDGLKDLPPLEPLIDGVLDMDTLAVLYGRSGSYKSFVAVDWALSVSTGSWWHKRMVRPGPVLYIIGEGAQGMQARLGAWQVHNQTYTAGAITWLPYAVNLFEPGWAAALVSLVSEERPALVVIDTLAMSMIGGDENTARDMGVVVGECHKVREACGCCVLLVHHTGKAEAAGMRGHSSLEAACNTAWSTSKDDGALELTSEKQKDRTDGEKIKLQVVAAGQSIALAPYTGHGTTEPDELSDKVVEMLADLAAVDLGPGVTNTVWKVSSKMAERTFLRWKKRVIDLGLVQQTGTKFALTVRGAAASRGEDWHQRPPSDAELFDDNPGMTDDELAERRRRKAEEDQAF